MDRQFKILVINPGSTSTDVAYYEDDRQISIVSLEHPSDVVLNSEKSFDQYEMRKKAVMDYVASSGIDMHSLSAIMSRGGTGKIDGGAYVIDANLVDKYKSPYIDHISCVSPVIAYSLSQEYGVPAYIYDAVGTDEFEDISRVSGMPELPWPGGSHTLNVKAVARISAENLGKKAEECTFIITHMGGGISTNYYKHGKIVDMAFATMTPITAGYVHIINLIKYCFSGKDDMNTILKKEMGRGGLSAYLGTKDLREVESRIEAGDERAAFYFEAMVYQIAKDIGSIAAAEQGKAERIILTGGLAKSKRLVERLSEYVSFIAPIDVYPGAFEVDALAKGGLRVLRGEEEAKIYIPENYQDPGNFCEL